jgi:hypothetical protein
MPAQASRVGTITDPLKGRVVTDEFLQKVDADSPDATFVFKPADLTRVIARREELGLGTEAEAERAQKASRKVEVANAERRIATLQAEIEVLREAVAADAPAKTEAKAKA